ncbi:MAG: YwaF family protein [Clostridia bacterium]|nr:YwaF family protein [Clostridia bacterium]
MMTQLSNLLDEWMEATAWEMTTPKSYGSFHLIFTFVGFALCVLIAYLLRNTGERGNRIFLFSTGFFLMLTEVYKQLFYYYHMNDRVYNFGIFPFQLCSVPMYLCVIVAFLKPGKLRSGMYGFMTTFNLLGGLMAFIEPSGINHGHWTLTLHAYVWHMMLVLIGFYLIASGRCAKIKRDYWHSVVTFVALCVVAFLINVSLWRVSNGGINMFFVGPRNSSLLVFKQISEAAGWYVSTLLYIPAVCLGAFVIYYPVHLYYKKKKAATAKEESHDQTRMYV